MDNSVIHIAADSSGARLICAVGGNHTAQINSSGFKRGYICPKMYVYFFIIFHYFGNTSIVKIRQGKLAFLRINGNVGDRCVRKIRNVDEKISGSIHFTPGCCYDDCYNGNVSAVHWDLVQIQTKEYGGGEIYLDGELIRKDGRFVTDDLLCLNPENLK